MSDDDSYWLHAILWTFVVLLAVALVFVLGLILGAAYLISGLAR